MLCPKRLGAFVSATVVLTLTLGLLAPTPAGATTGHGAVATPANLTPHPWPYDGCSASPERGPGWDFHHACIHHDGCYRGHWAVPAHLRRLVPPGHGWASCPGPAPDRPPRPLGL